MRNVLKNTAEVFHYWANQVQSSGRAGSVRFDGPVLFSYAEPIALLVEDGVVLRTGTWSITTCRHQSAAAMASRHLKEVYAPCIRTYGLSLMHRENKTAWRGRIAVALGELQDHPRRKKRLHGVIQAVLDQRNAYRDFFKLDWEDADLGAITKEVEAARVEREEAQRLALIEGERRYELAIAAEAEAIAKWRAGADRHGYFETCALRVKDGNVETSQGAEFPIEHAARVWPVLCRLKAHRKTYQRNGHTIHLGVYALDNFDLDGTLRAGCHTVPWGELQHAAELLGLAPFSDDIEHNLEESHEHV